MTENSQKRATEGDEVGRLLRLAGPRPAVPEERARRVRHNVKAVWRQDVAGAGTRSPTRRWWLGLIPLAATAAGLAVLLVGDRAGEKGSASNTQPTVASVLSTTGRVESGLGLLPVGAFLLPADTIVTAAKGAAALRLADGALVRIDSSTRVRIDDGRRLTLLEGRVYADCGRGGATSPIEIRTSKGVVTDIGTQFSVAERLGDGLIIRVREGRVRLAGELGTFTTEAGSELTIDTLGQDVRTREILGYGPDWQWTLTAAPALEIEGRTLGVFLDWVERETGWKIELPNRPELREIKLFGSIEGLRPDEAPAAVLPTCGLDFDVIDGVLRVRTTDS